MTYVLVAIALKSVIVAGTTLGLLALLKNRSAAERSWVAHIGLLALVSIALAPLVLPSWNVETSLMGSHEPAVIAPDPAASTHSSGIGTTPVAPAVPETVSLPADNSFSLSPAAIAALAVAGYAVPAAILLLLTFLALARLIALRARADVLVDGHWLSALARAQRRMGFKHGTALLTSDDLASPISWGFVRPVILLNSRAVEAAGEAEAIISHELAHVARFDWVKLLLARVATALFWFNPLVWMLSREAHQLREEAADDAVLAADIADTDYAQLLVGVARHECSGLFLGAHGVAPSKGSLARRITRVLDSASPRGPVARSFAFGVFTGALLIAAPLAALNLGPARPTSDTPASAGGAASVAASDPVDAYYPRSDVPADLPSIIADGVSTAVAAVAPATFEEDSLEAALERIGEQREQALEAAAEARERAAEHREAALESAARAREVGHRARDAAQLARDAGQRARDAAQRARDAGQRARDEAARARQSGTVERAIQMSALGVTPEYISAMRAAAPRLRSLNAGEFTGMKAVGVTPEYAREMAMALPTISADQLTEARAVGVSGSYVRAMTAAGVRAQLDDYVELRAVGVSPSYVEKMRQAGYVYRGNVDQLVEMYVLGVSPKQLRSLPPLPPSPPAPPPSPSRRRSGSPPADQDHDAGDG